MYLRIYKLEVIVFFLFLLKRVICIGFLGVELFFIKVRVLFVFILVEVKVLGLLLKFLLM